MEQLPREDYYYKALDDLLLENADLFFSLNPTAAQIKKFGKLSHTARASFELVMAAMPYVKSLNRKFVLSRDTYSPILYVKIVNDWREIIQMRLKKFPGAEQKIKESAKPDASAQPQSALPSGWLRALRAFAHAGAVSFSSGNQRVKNLLHNPDACKASFASSKEESSGDISK